MSKKTAEETTLYHPFIEGIKHLCHSLLEKEAWQKQGWVDEEPEYDESGAVIERVVVSPPGKPAAASK